MEAITRNGKKLTGKVAELFVKIGIATPPDGVVKPIAKPVKKAVKPKVKK